MLTPMSSEDFTALLEFLATVPTDTHVYGYCYVCKEENGIQVRVGTYRINNAGEEYGEYKSVNYFISGENIEGVHYSQIDEISLVAGSKNYFNRPVQIPM